MRGCLIGCLSLVVFSFSGASVSLDNNLASARMNALSLAPSGTVTIVTIDAESISKAGEWPWPRERFAQALDNLNAAGAGMIALDVDFSARSSPEGDAALVQARLSRTMRAGSPCRLSSSGITGSQILRLVNWQRTPSSQV